MVDSCQRLPLLRPVVMWNCADKMNQLSSNAQGRIQILKYGDEIFHNVDNVPAHVAFGHSSLC